MASNFADAVIGRFSKGKSEDDTSDDAPLATPDDSDQKPGAMGKMLETALNKGDGEAIEEAVKAICGHY